MISCDDEYDDDYEDYDVDYEDESDYDIDDAADDNCDDGDFNNDEHVCMYDAYYEYDSIHTYIYYYSSILSQCWYRE